MPRRRPDGPRTWHVVGTVSLGTVMLLLSGSALNLALPLLAEHYRAGSVATTWIVLGFTLTQTSLLVVSGRVADRFDRRLVYLVGIALFVATSLGAGWAGSMGLLIGLRVLQGVAAALVMANGTALIAAAVPPERLSQSMGVYLGIMAAAPLLGPSLGGYLAENVGWQWVFWLNVPVGLAALLWGALVLPRVKGARRDPVDLPGAALLTGWLGLLVLLVSRTASGGFEPVDGLVLALMLLLLAGFAARQRFARVPLIDPALFRDRPFVFNGAASALGAMGWIGEVFLMALYFQNVYGLTTAQAGLAVLPGPLIGVAAAPLSGFLGRRFAPGLVARYGIATAAAGLALLAAAVGRDTPYAVLAVGMVLVSAGNGVFYTANTTVIMTGVPEERLGLVNGVRLTLHSLGLVLAPALCAALAASRLPAPDRHLLYASAAHQPGAEAVDALVAGYRLGLSALAATATLAVVLTVAAARSAPDRRDPAPAGKGVPQNTGSL
ncbi:MFS transporter [Actinocorallia sp. API 0066]|uniref:MFS transporter n=1 Tax=Actinocorallia sp. API 0066 TaxID=2896846 RepID=UPI001E3AED06|nr:MFS transporter [Actinocorallia sp. API 0066]MCD0449295.1 MFS transporter [Actinocorallia sp. API 0066]